MHSAGVSSRPATIVRAANSAIAGCAAVVAGWLLLLACCVTSDERFDYMNGQLIEHGSLGHGVVWESRYVATDLTPRMQEMLHRARNEYRVIVKRKYAFGLLEYERRQDFAIDVD